MKAKYSLPTNTLTEIAKLKEPDSLRAIPCTEESKAILKDGETYEEKVHFKLGFETCAEHYGIYDGFDCDECKIIAYPLPQPVQEDELWKDIATTIALIHSEFWIDKSKFGFDKAYGNLHERMNELKSKYAITKKH